MAPLQIPRRLSGMLHKLNMCPISIKCHLRPLPEESQFIFADAESMARILGVGVPHCRVSIGIDTREILIEEISEYAWKDMWSSTYYGPFRNAMLALGPAGPFCRVEQHQDLGLKGGTTHEISPVSAVHPRSPLSGATTSAATDVIEDKLAIRICFLAQDCQVYEMGHSRWTETNNSTLNDVSIIRPTLTLHFRGAADERYLKATLKSCYQMVFSESHQEASKQVDLRVSFEPVEQNHHQFLEHNAIISPVELVKCLYTQQFGATSTQQILKTVHGSVESRILNTASANLDTTQSRATVDVRSNNDETKYKSKLLVLTNFPSFRVTDQTTGEKLAYQAHLIDAIDAGVWSSSGVTMEVEGTWAIFGEGTDEYRFQASKELKMSALSKADTDVEKLWNSWFGSTGVTTEFESTSYKQVFTRRFVINHNFLSFLECHGRDDIYRWIMLQCNEHNPLPDVIRAMLEHSDQ